MDMDSKRGCSPGTEGWGRSDNHKIVEWFGLEGGLKGHPVPTPCHRSSLPLDQVNQIPVQLGWNPYRNGKSTAPLGSPSSQTMTPRYHLCGIR